MKLYLISNNLLLDGLSYDNSSDLDLIRSIRPLSYEGEKLAKNLAEKSVFNNVNKIYSSFYASSLSSAKYLADKLGLDINLNSRLNECKVGLLGSKNMKMVKGLQDHEFTYKLLNGESLMDVGNRLQYFVDDIAAKEEDVVLFTHKRIILGYLIKNSKVGYNLDDNLILEYDGNIIYDDTENDIDIYEIVMESKKIVSIKTI